MPTAPEDLDAETEAADAAPPGASGMLAYLLLGILFGVILIKSEVVSWFRIQEMFRFDAFHMYGVLGSGVAVAAVSLILIRRAGLRTKEGERIGIPRKEFGSGYRYGGGGLAFGMGWALTGACPGPILALIGAAATA